MPTPPPPPLPPAPPLAKDLLAHDETIINPFYMGQLLLYGIKLGREGTMEPSANNPDLIRDAEVRSSLNLFQIFR